MKEKIIWVNGLNEEAIEEQYSTCEQYLCETTDLGFGDDVAGWVAEGSRYTARAELNNRDPDRLPDVSILIRRPTVELPDDEPGFFKHVRDVMRGDSEREVIVADPASISGGIIHDITESGATVTIADIRVSFHTGATLDDIKRTLTIHRDALTTDDGAEIIEEQWSGGRPPLGTRVDAGRLVKADNYDDVRVQLQMVAAGDKTATAAADELGCARGTIINAGERAAMYQLPQQ
ncbi:hypothetical protein EXE46_15645 [Halorubrum sp. GN11_10-6_MGM]|uniref:hypothetical protein n=1 Tax=Halorubrum sp. GN11_10-6_MGM TaxID=2518112 RepID=UPI0010F95319|nr:hypothetical protein [Halorubrum sp. GN11_10-6_MGM]TKX72616.1 hypothetical protein EXE46_15645 [Halorubrum sp. GN11_10-6_MGM]